MQARRELDRIAGVVRAASASTEARFLEIGTRLESSAERLAMLTRTFDTLSDAMKSESLRQAARDLSQVAARVSALAQGQNDDARSFLGLTGLTTAIEGRILRMAAAIKGVGILATNAKIAAAHIRDAEVDFAGFAAEINRTLKLAQNSLDHFAAELAGVGHHLRAAVASQAALKEHQSAAVHTIPLRLAQSVDAITARGQRAVAVAAAVGQGSQRIAQRIGNAVMALQVGDITRQRIEHVDYALGLLAETLPVGGDVPDGGDPLVAFGCRVQAAQLLDAGDGFHHEIRQIRASLQELATDAHAILRHGQDVFGAAGEGPVRTQGGGDRQGSFLGALEKEVDAVGAILHGFGAARAKADEVAASVSGATARLASHIRTLRSLESDIRLMGLNTTLKCGRLGTAGRPLAIIAQELRSYANQIAVEASAVMSDLDQVVAIADALSTRLQAGGAGEIASVSEIMARSLSCLSAAGESLGGALAALEQDGAAVAGLLRETAARTSAQEETSALLRQAAAELAGIVPDGDGAAPDSPQGDAFIAQIARSYTMARERAILDRHAPGRVQSGEPAAPPSGPASAAAELEDIFF